MKDHISDEVRVTFDKRRAVKSIGGEYVLLMDGNLYWYDVDEGDWKPMPKDDPDYNVFLFDASKWNKE